MEEDVRDPRDPTQSDRPGNVEQYSRAVESLQSICMGRGAIDRHRYRASTLPDEGLIDSDDGIFFDAAGGSDDYHVTCLVSKQCPPNR